ncbi:tetratricopeptide repeat protein [Nonomuraea sp. NPDC050790]|uniref:tetratricopeptide repeat protein n=1 Tax=Nonomuraea sp. NPDC050790 TaxID=3364371 RepID=UPI00378A33EA
MNLPTIDADRRPRGPYTFGAALLDALVPVARPELVAAHDIEIRAAAPHLASLVPRRRGSLADDLPREQRILIPGAGRTLRLANGLAEFVRDCLAGTGPLAVTVANLAEADPTDAQLVEVLRRRVPELEITEVAGRPVEGPFAADYDRFRDEGFHHAMAEAGLDELARLGHDDDPERWWTLLHRTTAALEAIGREGEARRLYETARRVSTEPRHRATVACSIAMLYVRHHDPGLRDPEEALAWINEAITITSLLPDRRERAFHLGFDLNGKALIEVRRGRPAAALTLVERAVELAERDLPPDLHPIHRLVLRANRGQLLGALGRTDEALADYAAAIAADPGYPDYYLDRGTLLHRLGRLDEAVADYESAMRVSPPFPEPYYNRAEVRYARGDLAGALADLDYALELDPGFAPAYVNRAGLRIALGDQAGAREDVVAGLGLTPREPYLLCVLGQVEQAAGRRAAARAAFDGALELDGGLAAAWAGRGGLSFEEGAHEAAVADLTRALELGEKMELLFNRALALRAAGREREARADLARAALLDPDDPDVQRELGR